MNPELNCLIVDDHPMLIDGYISVITTFVDNYNFNFIKATDCETGFKAIELHHSQNTKIDVAIFDINLPAYHEKNILCGSDLALHFKTRFETSKTIMITMHHESIIIEKTLSKVNPDGFLNKSDIGFDTFTEIFEMILSGKKFTSTIINNSIKELNKKKYSFDSIDYEIISLLEKGIKTKNLPNYIPITLSAIEKRKAKIKHQVLNETGNDQELIAKIKELNLI